MNNAEKAFGIGLTANELSQKITGTSEVSATRTTVATCTGATIGAAAAGALIVTTGVVAAPITVSLAEGSAIVAGIASLFD